MALSEQLINLRKKKGTTQKALANYLHVTAQAVSKWECGKGFPDIALLPDIAEFYSVSIEELLGVEKK